MTIYQKVGTSLSLQNDVEKFKEEDLINQQIEMIKKQSKFFKKRWTPLHLSDDRLSSICTEVFNHLLDNHPESDPGRSIWANISQHVDNGEIMPTPAPSPLTYLSANGKSWDVVFIPRDESLEMLPQRAGNRHSSRVLIKVASETKPNKEKEEVWVDYPMAAASHSSEESDQEVNGRLTPTEEKTSKTVKTIMLSFHTKRPHKPLMRKITIQVTPRSESDYYKSKFKRASFEADPKKHHEYRGVSNFYSYGLIDYPGTTQVNSRSLLEIKFDTEKLRKGRKRFGKLPQAEAIFPLMKECLEVVRGPVKSHVPVVQRRLSLGLIRVHQQLSDLGIPTYHAWIAKSKYACDAGINLKDNQWVPNINHLKLIKYTSPENIANLNRDGTVTGYVPRPGEDIWALGVIFFILLWDSKEPDFIKLHKKIRDLAKADPFDQEAFELEKKNLVKAYYTFHAAHCEEAEGDPLKEIVLDMLQHNPKARITASECLERLKGFIEMKKE